MVPMFFPVLGAHISGAEFQYPDNSWKELCGKLRPAIWNQRLIHIVYLNR